MVKPEMMSAGEAFDAELKDQNREQIDKLYEEIVDRLKYRYDLPAERLLPKADQYDRFMCRTNVIDAFNKDVQRFAESVGTNDARTQQLDAWITELYNLARRTKDRMKTPEEMEVVKTYVGRIVEICKDIK